jgi:hypothetical protein
MAIPLIAAALYGMAGWQNNNNRKRTEARQDMDDAWAEKERKRKEQEWDEADQLKIALKDAGAVRTEQQGTLTQGQTGGVMQRMFNQNPEEAQRVKGMMDAEAEMTGAAPAMAEPGTAITGKMSRGHQIGQTMGAMGADPNSTEAVAQRTAQAYRQNGQMDKAITMENAIMDQQAKRLGLSIDQLKFADMKTNRALENALKSAPTWYEGAAKFVTDLQRGGLKEMKAEHQLSPDGKSVTLFAVMPDGTKQATGTYPADESGMLQFIQKFATLPIEKRMDVMADTLKSEREQANKNRTHELDVTKAKNTNTYQMGMLELNRARASNAGGGQGGQGGQPGPVWDAKADSFLLDKYSVKDPNTGQMRVDGQGLQFGKALALARTQMNGGDTTSGLGFAFQKDGELRELATDQKGVYDPVKHGQLRNQVLAQLTAPLTNPQTQAAAGTPLPKQGQVAPGVGAPQAGANAMQNPAAANQQLALQQQKEDEEMMLGKRRAYSPEIQAIVDAKAKEKAKAQAEYLAREQARMLTPR